MPSSKEEHVAQLESLGFDCPMVEALAKMWKPLEDEGYEMYASTPAQTARPLKATRHASFAQRERLASAEKKSLRQARTALSCILCAAGATRCTWSTTL